MASVHQRKNSPYWTMVYRLPNGKWCWRSSRTKDRYKAYQLALKLEGTDPKEQSRKWANDVIEQLFNATNRYYKDPLPLSEWLVQWRTPREKGWSESTRKSFMAVERSLISRLGHVPLGDLTRTDVANYRDWLRRNGRKSQTVKQHIKYLKSVLDEAVAVERIVENPADGIKLPKDGKGIKKAFTLDQFKALLNKTDGEWHLLILVAGLTGQRLMDCLALQYEDIDRKNGLIRFRRSKNADEHIVPLHEAVAKCAENRPGGVLFEELGKLPKTGSRSVSARFREDILPLIDIVQPYASNLNGSKQVTEYSFHSLRHMLSTELNRAGVSPETRMAIVGHTNAKVSAGYTHAQFEDAVNALRKIGV